MGSKLPFLSIRFRAIAQATEVEEKVASAIGFASGSENIEAEETKGHFGNPIIIFEAKLSKASDMKLFLGRLKDAGILEMLTAEMEQRLDDECNFHFRLDKQAAFDEVLALAKGRA